MEDIETKVRCDLDYGGRVYRDGRVRERNPLVQEFVE